MTTNVNLGFVAAAGGTVDAITATYSPAPTALVDKMLLWFRATGTNTSTTPTFSPNGLTARAIVKKGGTALVAGDIPAANAIMEVVYDAGNTRWELVNPAVNRSYKVYSALLNQTGTNAPVATVLENTIGSIVFGYLQVGEYSLTLTGAFPAAKTWVVVNPSEISTDFNATFSIGRSSDNAIWVNSYHPTLTPSNDILINTPIEIRVYY